MPLSWCWCWSTALWSLPCHDFKIQDVDVVEVHLAIPAAKHVHFGSTYNICWMIESCMWSSSSSWSLVPCHCDWIQCMKIFECLILASLTTKYDNSRTSEQSCVSKSWLRRCTLYLRLNPSTWIQVQDMSIVQIYITLLLSTIVMTCKIQDRGTNQCSWVSTSCTWWYALNLWECPEPWSLHIYTSNKKIQIGFSYESYSQTSAVWKINTYLEECHWTIPASTVAYRTVVPSASCLCPLREWTNPNHLRSSIATAFRLHLDDSPFVQKLI